MFNVGDMVKVIGPQSETNGWVKSMNRFVGKTMIVSSVSGIGVRLEESKFIFLDTWLKPIEECEIIVEDLTCLV